MDCSCADGLSVLPSLVAAKSATKGAFHQLVYLSLIQSSQELRPRLPFPYLSIEETEDRGDDRSLQTVHSDTHINQDFVEENAVLADRLLGDIEDVMDAKYRQEEEHGFEGSLEMGRT